MRRKSLAMLFVIALILPTILLTVPTVVAATLNITCDINPDHGPVGTVVTVSGEIYPAEAGHTINVYWEEKLNPAALVCSDDTDSNGYYECTFIVMADVKGDHSVIAVDMDTGATPLENCGTAFEIKPLIELCPICGTCCTDLTATGTGFPGDTWIKWQTPSWDTDPDSGEVKTSPSGSWSVEVHVEECDPGVYEFCADSVCAEFMVGPLLLLDRCHGQPCECIAVEGCLPGLAPGTTVYIYFEHDLDPCVFGTRILVGTATVSKCCGYFEGTFHVPNVPSGCYIVNATDDDAEEPPFDGTVWAAYECFGVCPCISIDPIEGQVGDCVEVSGCGYTPSSKVTIWMSGLLPADVPLEAIVSFYQLMNFVWAWDETDMWLILTVGYFLPVATDIDVDCYGCFGPVSFEIPECWGGYHPIVATDDEGYANIIGNWRDFYDCPVFPDGLLLLDCCATVVDKPGILRVLPDIWTDPACGVSGQTITLYGTGLSAFEFYVRYTDIDHDKYPDMIERCSGEIYVYKRCSGFVLDFGPNERWIDGPYFPYMFLDYATGHFILNGQYDGSWSTASWPPTAYAFMWGCPPIMVLLPPVDSYSPLMLNPRGTLVSDGMSYSMTLDVDYSYDPCLSFCERFNFTCAFAWEYRQTGSPFLTVPWLQPQDVTLTAYRFDYIEIDFQAQWPGQDVLDLSLEFLTYDYDETATADFTIECLQVDTDVTCPECPDVDLSGIEARLDALEGDLDALVAQLEALDSKITGLITNAEGNIIAEIETAVGTIQEDLSALDAKIVKLDGDIATIGTAIGDIAVTLDELNTYVTVDLTNDIASIEMPDLGTIEGKLVEMEGEIATIETDIGTITTKADLIVNHTGSMPVTIALSLIAAISAIAAAVLILRKVYIA